MEGLCTGVRASSDRRSQSIRARVDRYGLRTVCLNCGTDAYRHRPEQAGRLRNVRCPSCRRVGSIKTLAWVRKNPERARMRRRDFDAVAYVMEDR